ncbi:hypothetical protein AB7813_05430 [Tardiphaga sp. 20_F10_N6_6]|uniref:hypothetical protein n=1 Tax=Tardiphaga sp. 20_F10_N6_6 TaxID=3240788 RepID=UPI003F8B010C
MTLSFSFYSMGHHSRVQIKRQQKDISSLQKAGISTGSAVALLERMQDKVDGLCQERDRLNGEERLKQRTYPSGKAIRYQTIAGCDGQPPAINAAMDGPGRRRPLLPGVRCHQLFHLRGIASQRFAFPELPVRRRAHEAGGGAADCQSNLAAAGAIEAASLLGTRERDAKVAPSQDSEGRGAERIQFVPFE